MGVVSLGMLALRHQYMCTAENAHFETEMRVLAERDGWQLIEVGWAFLWRHRRCGVLWNACDPDVVPPEHCGTCQVLLHGTEAMQDAYLPQWLPVAACDQDAPIPFRLVGEEERHL